MPPGLHWCDLEVLRATVALGHKWLTGTAQSGEAIVSHHGCGNRVGGGILGEYTDGSGTYVESGTYVSFHPGPPHNGTPGHGVVVLDLGWVETPGKTVPRVMTAEDVEVFEQILTGAGFEVADRWNGVGAESGSWAVEGVHPSLSAAEGRYLSGCPTHGHVFCSRDGCTWLDDGGEAATMPRFPDAPRPGGGGAGVPPEDRNLRVVWEALRWGRPIVEDFGVAQQTVLAGRRGVIVEASDGALSFEQQDGVGVWMPAEVFRRLVDLAAAGDEMLNGT